MESSQLLRILVRELTRLEPRVSLQCESAFHPPDSAEGDGLMQRRIERRDFLRIGSLGGLRLGSVLRLQDVCGAAAKKKARAYSAVSASTDAFVKAQKSATINEP